MAEKYIFQNGLRLVVPYFYEFRVFVKGRWVGKTVMELFTTELEKFNDERKIVEAIKNKSISLERKNELMTGPSVANIRIVLGDILHRKQHKHEPVVVDGGRNAEGKWLDIVFEDDNLLVVNKPSGIPAHPTGSYYYNSVLEVLKYELNLPQLFTIHRLDRLTSGILILGKNAKIANYFARQMAGRTFDKKYLAKVKGRFPQKAECKDRVFMLTPSYKLKEDQHKIETKSAFTEFKLVSYNSDADESLVECLLHTGRTHQIRIHLRNLKFPIANDPLYGPDNINKIKNNIEIRLIQQLTETSSEVAYMTNEEYLAMHQEYTDRIVKFRSQNLQCDICDQKLFNDVRSLEAMQLYLHAWKCTNLEYNFETAMPQWALACLPGQS